MALGKESILVEEGESICIHPGTPHNIKNIGDEDFRLLYCCSPAYSHDNTEILECKVKL
jgi:mannose-6-phosphate isomerase-like protein (cupin superfamily)